MRANYITKRLPKPKQQSKGFSAIKFLIAGGVTGVLTMLPSPALSQLNRIADLEARISIATLNRNQQLYFLENDEFAAQPSLLGGFPAQTVNYRYRIVVPQGLNYPAVVHQAQPRKRANRAVIGGVALAIISGVPQTVSLRCLALSSPASGGANGTELPIFATNGAISCPTGYRPL